MKSSSNHPLPGECFAGVGIDMVDIPRFRQSLAKHGKRFCNRVFLPSEQKYCHAKVNPWIHYAGRFAAKEAVAKAFGTGIGGKIGWLDIEIVSSGSGAPIVRLSRRAQLLMRLRRVKRVVASISHTHTNTIAVALLTT